MLRARWATFAMLAACVTAMSLALAHASSTGTDQSDDATSIPPAVEQPAGGLVFASRQSLSIDSEVLTIGLDRVEIDYAIRSTVSRPQNVVMAFPLPTIDILNLYGAEVAIPAFDPANPTNFVAFWTTLNGIAVEPDVTLRAYAIGQVDITTRLQAHGLPLFPLTPGLSDRLALLSQPARRELEEAGAIEVDNGKVNPLWALRTIFHWGHLLDGDATVSVRHHYKPIAGSASWSDELKEKAKTKYCLSDDDIAALDKRASDGKAPTVYWVHYAPGHNSWLKGPSASHAVVVERPDGKGIASTCAKGTREASDTSIRITSQNRIDDVEIDVLFVE